MFGGRCGSWCSEQRDGLRCRVHLRLSSPKPKPPWRPKCREPAGAGEDSAVSLVAGEGSSMLGAALVESKRSSFCKPLDPRNEERRPEAVAPSSQEDKLASPIRPVHGTLSEQSLDGLELLAPQGASFSGGGGGLLKEQQNLVKSCRELV